MHSKKSVASLSTNTVAYIYLVLSANFDNPWPTDEIVESNVTKAPTLVLGKELQPVIGNLAENILIFVRTTSRCTVEADYLSCFLLGCNQYLAIR